MYKYAVLFIMAIPIITSCCCFNLRTTGLFIGRIELLAIVIFIFCLKMFVSWISIANLFTISITNQTHLTGNDYGFSGAWFDYFRLGSWNLYSWVNNKRISFHLIGSIVLEIICHVFWHFVSDWIFINKFKSDFIHNFYFNNYIRFFPQSIILIDFFIFRCF